MAMRRSLSLAALLLAVGLASCQKAPESKEALLEAQVCESLQAVGTALDQVASLKPTSTVGEATTANRALTSSMEALNQSEALLEKLRLRQFRDQVRTFNREATRVTNSKELTLKDAAAELKSKAQPVIAARRRVSEQVKCPAPAGPQNPAK
jgi:hypothetical protein